MEIPESYVIHDIRSQKDFKGITICGYKRKDVLNTFQNCMINNKLEDAIRWCVELHATGLNNNIWDSIKNIYFKYIHINNPKYFFYLLKREKEYKNIISKYPKKHEIYTRNNQEIRNLYAELTAISSLIKKNNIFLPRSLPVINNKSFEKDDIHKRMISKDLDKINDFIFNTTTNEMKLALNEISNNLSLRHGTFENCIYWYLWLEKIENLKKKENNILFSNNVSNNENKYFDHWIFILWKILNNIGEKYIEKNNLIFLKKLYHEYIKNFKISHINKKKYYIFIAFFIIKNNVNWNINIFQNEHLIIQSNANINIMYENIIKNNESNLSIDAKNILYKKYNQLYYNINNTNTIPKKIKNTNLDEDINVVMFTNYPDYKESSLTNNENMKKELISKNMSIRDVEDSKLDIKNKKIDALVNFVTYKKKNNIQSNIQTNKQTNTQTNTQTNIQNNIQNNIKENNVINNIENNHINKSKSVIDYYNQEEINENEIFIKNINFSKRK
jgi:hypothetical protein